MSNLPSPIEIFTDPITLIILGVYVGLFVWESLFPRVKNLPQIRMATLRGIIAMVIFFMISTYLPIFTDEYLARFQLINLSDLPVFAQVMIGLLFYELVLYFYHRGMHASNFPVAGVSPDAS